MDEHLREKRISDFLKWVDSNGYITIGSDLFVMFFDIISVIFFANSIWDAIGLLFFEAFFEAGAIPAGVSVLSKKYDPTENRKTYVILITTWVIIVLSIITLLFLQISEYDAPHCIAYIALFFFAIIAVAWEVMNEAEQ